MRLVSSLVAAAAVSALVATAAAQGQPGGAQAQKGPPNALQGFSQNRNEPVHIEAASLEVRDKEQVATFTGDVRVQQGDTTMRCATLVVFYDREAGNDASKAAPKTKTMTAATPGPGGEQKIKRLEARGSVVVTQKEQTATGKLGIFDMGSNTVTLTGDVVMTQGQNVLRGDKLVVNLTDGVSKVESAKNGRGRVEGLFVPSDAPKTGASGGKPAIPGKPF
jgi:lipopolysaccharide export system protein LptA